MAHCERGDEYICRQTAHNYKFEGGGAAVIGSIQSQPIENEVDDSHFAKTRLLSLENTIGGKVLGIDYLIKAREFVDQHNLALHLMSQPSLTLTLKKSPNILIQSLFIYRKA